MMRGNKMALRFSGIVIILIAMITSLRDGNFYVTHIIIGTVFILLSLEEDTSPGLPPGVEL